MLFGRSLFLLAIGLLAACYETQGPVGLTQGVQGAASGPEAAPPLEGVTDPYAAADRVRLEKTSPKEWTDLHNVFHLGARIVSGSEPQGEQALKRLADMGVRTILSVDGKEPDVELAARFGMRYVHIPIQYSGITHEEMLKIAKTFRERKGAFYVHCFHGRHRGPAAAAVGRVVLDGTSRELALAEMRQWCGTSDKYDGLYRTIATATMPTRAETESYAWDFPGRHTMDGFRQSMIWMPRAFDNLKSLKVRDWAVDPDHPDVDPRNEAAKLFDLYAQSIGLDEVKERPEDFRGWMKESVEASRDLKTHLERLHAGEEGAKADADAAFTRVQKLCNSCHADYRDH
mgnify:FL=1